jgi:hypothetical protein
VLRRTPRYHYWTVRAYVEGWVLLLIRRGPRAVWRRICSAPHTHPANFGFSNVALGYDSHLDVGVVLTPAGRVEPDPSIISPRRMRDFVCDTFPAEPVAPRLVALVSLEEEYGPRTREGFTGREISDYMGAPMGPVYLSVSAVGRLSMTARHIYRPPSEDTYWPTSEDTTLFEVVDVMLPLYLAASAIASGAYERLLGLPPGWRRRRYNWELEVEEHIAFPTPLAGSRTVGFPTRTPGLVPLGGGRPEPSEVFFRGSDLSRHSCRPERLVASVLGDLLAHWGYEVDPLVISDVVATLRLIRTGQLVR